MCFGDVLFRWILYFENCVAGHDLYNRDIVGLKIDAKDSASTVGNAAFRVKELVEEFAGTVASVARVTPRFAVAG